MTLPELSEAVVDGYRERAARLTADALADGAPAKEILQDCLVPAMDEVGGRFERSEYFLPEMLMSAKAVTAALEVLRPGLEAAGAEPMGRVVMATVHGDLHDIGKNLVGMMLRGAGFDVVDMGVDVRPEAIADEVEGTGAAFVGLSTLLTTTQPAMADAVEFLRGRFPPGRLRILVGGAPVTEAFAADIGADGTAGNASAAVRLARTMATG